MAQQAVRKHAAPGGDSAAFARHGREALVVVSAVVSLTLLVALATYHPEDPGWTHAANGGVIHNKAGVVGAWSADVLLHAIGNTAFLVPLLLGFSGWLVFSLLRESAPGVDLQASLGQLGLRLGLRVGGGLLTVLAGSGLLRLHLAQPPAHTIHGGGIAGDMLAGALLHGFGPVGAALVLLAVFFSGLTLCTRLSWPLLADRIGAITLLGYRRARDHFGISLEWLQGQQARREREAVVREEVARINAQPPVMIEPEVVEIEPSQRVEKERQRVLFDDVEAGALPTLDLLDAHVPAGGGYSEETLEALSRQVELKLQDFGVEVQVVEVHPGPIITRFELLPAAGVKASRISNLSKDLARSLSTVSVRVVEVIPGKSFVGLEIPNVQREMVGFRDILNSREYESAKSRLTMALGKDIAGRPAVADLARMPHLLVAGTTGSGKSVALNAMILSLLYKSSPKDVRMILIDPKMLELSVYDGIPALLAPVVTDMKDAQNALRWSVAEMERRYKLMAAMGVRNVAGFNRKVADAREAGEPLLNPLQAEDEAPEELIELPSIVIVVDELADMMMTVGKKVEELIARLAQKARAAGIHLILATQRPSVDVLTGLIKANIPTRMAFQVSSKVDSRTILDQMGAESLLGHGDMLYLPPGSGVPQRLHGAFVSDDEVQQVADFLRSQGEPEYVESVLDGSSESSATLDGDDGDETDELYDQAVRIVTETRKASISGVQRRLKVGYNRAARMIEQMERDGVVGEIQSNGSREVIAPPPPKD